jgi:hypothetical protein
MITEQRIGKYVQRSGGGVIINNIPAFAGKKSANPSKPQQNINQRVWYKGLYRWVERCGGTYCPLLTRTILTLTA